MSNTVDNRVVSMEFDNAKFERNVETSLNTLKHLDQSLDSLTNGSKAFDGVSFENLANQIDNIANRFTLMGRITMKVFDEIAGGIVNLGKKIVSFNTDQLESGWGKYADKTTSVQTIMSATGMTIEDVSEQLERLNRFTDETSYSFTDMTSNIAKFTSQGIGLETAVTQMQGIATWAASAGQNAQAASRAMYNISQAMGAGAMKLIDWKSIQNANMATKEFKEQAIAAAVSMGSLEEKMGKVVVKGTDLEVTTKNFEQTLQKGWFNTESMQKVFNDYGKFAVVIDEMYEKYDENIMVSKLLGLAEDQATKSSEDFEASLAEVAKSAGLTEEQVAELRNDVTTLNSEELKFSKATYKAAQEAKTFGDAIDAAKDAVSTSWMNVFETIFGNYEQARVLWTDLAEWFYDIFAEPINGLNDLFDTVLNTEFWKKGLGEAAQKNIKDTALAFLDFGDAAEKAFMDLGIVSEKDVETFGSVKEAIKNINLSADKVGNVIDNLLGGTTGSSKGISTLEDAKKIIDEIWHGDWGAGKERRDALSEAGYDPAKVQNVLNKLYNGFEVTEEDLTGLQTNIGKLSEEQIKSLTELKKHLDDGTASISQYEATYSKLTGRQLLFDKDVGAFYNLMEIVKNVKNTIGSAWDDIFGKGRVERIYNLISAFQAFTMKIRNLTKDNETFSNAMKALFTIFKIGGRAVSSVFTAISKIFSVFKVGNGGLSNFINKISDLVFQFDEWISKNEIFESGIETVVGWVKTFKDALGPTVDKVKEFVGRIGQGTKLKQAFSWISTGFAEGLNLVNIGITKLASGIDSIVDSAIDFYNTHIDSIFTSIQTAIAGWNLDRVVTMFTNAKSAVVDFFTLLWQFIKTGDWNTFVTGFTERFQTLVQWITTVRDTFTNWFGTIDKNTIRAIAGFGSALLGFIGILKLIKSFSSVKYAFIEFLSDMSSAVKTYARAKHISDILKIAASVAILAGSLYLIAQIPSDDLKTAAFVLGGIVAALVILSVAIGIFANTKGGKDMGMITASIAAFAVSIGILAAALFLLTKMEYKNVLVAFATLGSIVMLLTIAVGALSNINGKFASSGIALIGFAGGIILLVKALKIIQQDASYIGLDAFKKLSVLILILVGMGMAMRHVRLSSALGIVALAASLVYVQKKIKEAMENSIPLADFQTYWKELSAIFAILLGLGLVLRVSGRGSLKAVASILALIGLIFVVSNAIDALGEIGAKKLIKGTAAVVAIGAVFAALLWALGQAKGLDKSASKAIVAIVAGIITLMISLVVLSAVPGKDLAKGLIAITVVLGMLSGVLAAMARLTLYSKNANGWSFGTVLAVVVGIGILMLALHDLAKISQNNDSVLKAAASIGLVLVALAGSMALLSKANFKGFDSTQAIQMIVKMIAALIPAIGALWILQSLNISASIETVGALSLLLLALAGAMRIMADSGASAEQAIANGFAILEASTALILIATSLKILDNVNPEGLIVKVAALGLLLAALTGALYILSKSNIGSMSLGDLGKIGLAMIGLGGIIAAIAALFPLLDKIKDTSGLLTKVTALSEIILALSGAVLLLSFMPAGGAGGAAVGVLVVGEMMAVITALFGAFGFIISKVNEIDGVDDAAQFIIHGAEVLGEAIGKFVGAFVGGLLSGAVGAAADLTSFTAALEPFIDQVSRFDGTSLAGVGALTGLIMALAAADLVSAIGTVFNPGGWLTSLFGGESNDMATKLTKFAGAVKSYIDALADLDSGEVYKVSRITEAISSLLGNMPQEGGLFDIFTGSTSTTFSSLGGNLEKFGQAVVKFVDSVKEIPTDAVVKTELAVDAINSIVDFSTGLQKTGGLIQDIVGITDIGLFGEQLGKFVTALFGGGEGENASEGFFKALDKVEIDDAKIKKISDIKTALDPLVKIARQIPTMGGLIEDVIGTQDPATFTDKMAEFIKGIKKISEEAAKITDDDIEKIRKAKEAALATSELSAAQNGQNVDLSMPTVTGGGEAASELGGITTMFSSLENTVGSFDVGALTSKASAIKDGIVGIFSGADTGAMTTFSSAIEGVTTSVTGLTEASGALGPDFVESFSGLTTLPEQVGTALGDVSTTFDTNAATFQTSAKTFFGGLPTAIDETKGEAIAKADELIGSATASLDNGVAAVTTTGYNFAAGFAEGIKNGTYLAELAAQSMVSSAKAAADTAQKSHSPSRLLMQSGSYFSQGFAIGILSEGNTVRDAATKIVNVAADSVRTAAQMINEIIEDDASPVIRPVIDLSGVRDGANAITALTSGDLSRSVAMQFTESRRLNNMTNQNGINNVGPTYNIVIDGIKYNTDDYVDTSIQNFVETMVRKNKMYAGR